MDDTWIDHDYMAYPTIRSQVINWLNSDKQEVYNNPANRKLLKRWDWLNKKLNILLIIMDLDQMSLQQNLTKAYCF